MKIYTIKATDEKYDAMVMDEPFDSSGFLYGGSRKDNWKPVRCCPADEKHRRPLGDFTGVSPSSMFLSAKGADALKAVLNGKVELLATECEAGEYYLLNVTNIIDAFDHEHSFVKRFPNSEKIMNVYKFEFKKEALADNHIFRLREKSDLLVDDEFRKLVIENNLTGFVFREVWSDDPVENEKIRAMEIRRWSLFKIIREIDDEVMDEIRQNRDYLVHKYKCTDDAENWAETAYKILGEYLRSRRLPEYCDDKLDFELMLGSLFGEALRKGYGWKWMELGKKEKDVTYYIVSPQDMFCCQPFLYIRRIMNEENPGLNGENDNTVRLLYNMCEKMEDNPPAGLLFEIS